jgi:hypothetical protein
MEQQPTPCGDGDAVVMNPSNNINNINPEQALKDLSAGSAIDLHNLIAGSFISVAYGTKWYPGVIEKLCGDEVYVNFMQIKGVNKFAWPQRPDRLLVPWCDILCDVSPLVQNKNVFEMYKVEYDKSISAFDKWCED